MAFIGVAYAWSLFVTPLESEFGWKRDETSMIFAISITCFSIGTIIGGILMSKMGIKRAILASGLLLASGFALCISVRWIWQLFIFYGVFCGLGIGIAYNAIISHLGSLFPGKSGFVSGILLMGYGVGSFLFGSVISITNQNYGWRGTFIIFVLLFAVISLLTSLVMKKNEEELSSSEGLEEEFSGKQYTPGEMLKDKRFYVYYVWSVSMAAIGLVIVGHAALICDVLDPPPSMIIFSIGFLSVTNGVFRLIMGVLYDKVGRHFVMSLSTSLAFAGIVLILTALHSGKLALIFAGFACVGASFGGTAPSNAVFPKEIFGEKHYSRNFSFVSSSGVPAAFLGPYITGALIVSLGSYTKALPFLLIYVLLSAVSIILLKKMIMCPQNKETASASQEMMITADNDIH